MFHCYWIAAITFGQLCVPRRNCWPGRGQVTRLWTSCRAMPSTGPRLFRQARDATQRIHSMYAHMRRFAEADRKAANNMVACAEQNNMQRIIYLRGLGDKDRANLSHHLRSRHEVEEILEAGRVPVTNLRAAMILGSGSASFPLKKNWNAIFSCFVQPIQPHYITSSIDLSMILAL